MNMNKPTEVMPTLAEAMAHFTAVGPLMTERVSSQAEFEEAIGRHWIEGRRLVDVNTAGLPAGYYRIVFGPYNAFKA
jgi:hypothetical protein